MPWLSPPGPVRMRPEYTRRLHHERPLGTLPYLPRTFPLAERHPREVEGSRCCLLLSIARICPRK